LIFIYLANKSQTKIKKGSILNSQCNISKIIYTAFAEFLNYPITLAFETGWQQRLWQKG
jgi:hypothetical protein